MPRARYKPLNVFLNSHLVGRLLRERSGAVSFQFSTGLRRPTGHETPSRPSVFAEGAGAFRPLNDVSIGLAFRPGSYYFLVLSLHFCFLLVCFFLVRFELAGVGTRSADFALAAVARSGVQRIVSRRFIRQLAARQQ